MKFRHNLIVLAGAVALPAIANAGLVLMPGERGYVETPEPLLNSRAQVVQNLAAWKRSPVSADGWKEVGGQAGWVYVGSPNSRSRGDVREELMHALRNPVSPDGWRFFAGERGWTYVGAEGAGAAAKTADSIDQPVRSGERVTSRPSATHMHR